MTELTPRQSARLVNAWLARTGLTKAEAARALGISYSWMKALAAGRNPGDAAAAVASLTVRRAMRDVETHGPAEPPPEAPDRTRPDA